MLFSNITAWQVGQLFQSSSIRAIVNELQEIKRIGKRADLNVAIEQWAGRLN